MATIRSGAEASDTSDGSRKSGGVTEDTPSDTSSDKTGHDDNVVHVSTKQNKFVYADVVKYLLAGTRDGNEVVEVAGLGMSIPKVLDIIELLKSHDMVQVILIATGRGAKGRKSIDRITIRVCKSLAFDTVFEEQEAQKQKAKDEQTLRQQQKVEPAPGSP